MNDSQAELLHELQAQKSSGISKLSEAQSSQQQLVGELSEVKHLWSRDKEHLGAEIESMKAQIEQMTLQIKSQEELDRGAVEHANEIYAAVADARDAERAGAAAEITALHDKVKNEGLWAFEGKVRQVLVSLQQHAGETLPNKEPLLSALMGFFARCQAAQQLIVIHDETLTIEGLCQDHRTDAILQNLEHTLPTQGLGDKELEEMVASLQAELNNAEMTQERVLADSHQAWGHLNTQLSISQGQLEQAQMQAAEANHLAAALTERLTEIESQMSSGAVLISPVKQPSVQTEPDALVSLQSALREAIGEQVQMAQEVAMLEEKMVKARSLPGTPAKLRF